MTKKQWLGVKLLMLILVLFSIIGVSVKVAMVWNQNTTEPGHVRLQEFNDTNKINVTVISVPIQVVEKDVSTVTIKDSVKVFGFYMKHPITVENKEGVLFINQIKTQRFLNFITGHIVIEVPKDIVLEYTIKNISGSIDHDAPSKKTLTATSISGYVNVHQGGEKAHLNSTSGSVKSHQGFEALSATSVSGGVYVVVDERSRVLSAKSVSSGVNIKLEQSLGYTLHYSTVSGSVKDTYQNVKLKKSGEVVYGNGSLKMRASSVSGSIRLTDW